MKWRIGITLCVVSVSSLLLFGKPILEVNFLDVFMLFDLMIGCIGIGMMI